MTIRRNHYIGPAMEIPTKLVRQKTGNRGFANELSAGRA